jgi:hypothetical protein
MYLKKFAIIILVACLGLLMGISPVAGQLVDNNQSTNTLNAGINKTYDQEIGAGRGDVNTPDSSLFIMRRDPFRAIRRGRQLFQRKFTRAEGQGPRIADGNGNIMENPRLGAGLADSCAACHGRPRGAAGFGGDVATRPDSRDTPHLFGLGLREMLADEITQDLRTIRAQAITEAQSKGVVTLPLVSKGINYGTITAYVNGEVDTSAVKGVDPDLRIRPFFAQGGTISIREFIVGAAQGEVGIQAVDPDMYSASILKQVVTTPSGMVLNGKEDAIEPPPTDNPKADPDRDGVKNEMPTSIVDFLEFYLLNYFNTATYKETQETKAGRKTFMAIGCGTCHIPDLQINHDRRVANIDTVYDPVKGIFNKLFATATGQFVEIDDDTSFPFQKLPAGKPFLVKDIFTDFKRHDLGANFWERNYDKNLPPQKEFLTRALWGVGSTAPYGHDGRSINLREVILRHGGEAQKARDAFAALSDVGNASVLEFLNSMVIFPPDDTASNLDPGDPSATGFPQVGHGSIKLSVLFNDPSDSE